jgi:16S rRNA (cytosine967-C5)-methyltransferase
MQVLIRHFEAFLKSYTGDVPVHHAIKQYFRQHPILGSRDRKCITALAYSYFRTHRLLPENIQPEDGYWAGMILSNQPALLVGKLFPERPTLPDSGTLSERIAWLLQQGFEFQVDLFGEQFPELSEGLSKAIWTDAFFAQPRLFIKTRPKTLQRVLKSLSSKGFKAIEHSNYCLELPLNLPLKQFLKDADYRVQDIASQAVFSKLPDIRPRLIWDVCAGAGGKTLLLKERYPEATLLATDVRETALENLRERFRLYGYEPPWMAVFDAAKGHLPTFLEEGEDPDLVLCDVPCSGSGTWHRNPEQYFYFDAESLADFAERQFNITEAASKRLREGGYLLYVTCSVFQQENEAVAGKLAALPHLEFIDSQLLSHLAEGGDCLYVARFRKVKA